MNQNYPLITVLMPCYNAMPYLPEAIESIIYQTYTNLEILCINDGSTDNTAEVLEKYAAIDKRIKVVHNETNLGLIPTLNKGIDLAQGEYIARMDADDISDLKRIEIEYHFMLEHPDIDIVSTDFYVMDEKGWVYKIIESRVQHTLSCFYASFLFSSIGHAELLIKKNVLQKNKYCTEKIALHTEDYELWTRLFRKGYQLCNIKIPLSYYRINSKSVSRRYTEIQNKNFVICSKKHYYEYSNKDYPEEIMKVLVNRMDTSTTYKNLKEGIREMKLFKDYFIKKEKVKDKKVMGEIEIAYYTHLIDICYQFFKNQKGLSRLLSLFYLFINVNIFFKKEVLSYLKNKRKIKKSFYLNRSLSYYEMNYKKNTNYRQCIRCLMDTTDPEITFDEHGYCNHCTNFINNIKTKINLNNNPEILEKVINKIKKIGKDKPYDCIIGISGGVDSCYTAYLLRKHELRVLAVHMDNGWDTEISVKNIKELLDKLQIDYESYVLNWDHMRDLQLAFLKASVPEIETPTDIAILAVLHKVAAKYNVKYIVTGGNYASEGILPRIWHYNAKDLKYLKSIHKKFGGLKLKDFPLFGFWHEVYYKFIKNIRIIYLLNYVNYDKDEARQILENEYGWQYYGGKHYESRITAWVQSYVLPVKFNIDYRKATFSTQICMGKMTREEALKIIEKPSYNKQEIEKLNEYIAKKFEITTQEQTEILNKNPLWYYHYPNNFRILNFWYNVYMKIKK